MEAKKKCSVEFRIPFKTQFGQNLYVAGSIPELGTAGIGSES